LREKPAAQLATLHASCAQRKALLRAINSLSRAINSL
jgi:hypothetical protein